MTRPFLATLIDLGQAATNFACCALVCTAIWAVVHCVHMFEAAVNAEGAR